MEKHINGFDWYVATESASSVLNHLRAYYSREIGTGEDSTAPDLVRMAFMEKQLGEIRPILQQSNTFSDYGKMLAVIEKYAPQLKAINGAAI